MLFSERDIDSLRLLLWCQYVHPEDLHKLLSETEYENLASLKLIRRHTKSGAVVLTKEGTSLLKAIYKGGIPQNSQSYRPAMILPRLRLSKVVLTAYRGGVNPFTTSIEELSSPPGMFL